MTKRALWLLIAVSAVAGCTTYRERLARMSDDQVCDKASAGPGIGWNPSDRAAVAEAVDRGLSVHDCDPATRQCLDAGYEENTAEFTRCQLEVISMSLHIRAGQAAQDAVQSQIDSANARARDAEQRAWEAEQRAHLEWIRRQDLE